MKNLLNISQQWEQEDETRGRELKYFCKWSGNEKHFSESLYARSLYFRLSYTTQYSTYLRANNLLNHLMHCNIIINYEKRRARRRRVIISLIWEWAWKERIEKNSKNSSFTHRKSHWNLPIIYFDMFFEVNVSSRVGNYIFHTPITLSIYFNFCHQFFGDFPVKCVLHNFFFDSLYCRQ
jgi:hypothetical protein